jgi:eukaryotic-like serine/threonine-protein kinase
VKPAPDIKLDGRYRLVSKIATGGMGEVWVAHDEALARDVAVKVLREEFAGDSGFLERFRVEARNSASLSHPNIAQLYDYGEQDGSGYLVMELVVGEPMSDLLEREPVLSARRLLPLLAQTARALHAAHVGGVVHRDVKPGNILISRGGRVKITDFGVSLGTNQASMTATGMVMGTAQYLSPEQAVGKAAAPASDIYSLGIVAYEALVGHRPFTGPTAVDIAVAHVNRPVPAMPASVDKRLADLVMLMLSKNPEQRPRSAASLARLLDELVEETPPEGVPVIVSESRTVQPAVGAGGTARSSAPVQVVGGVAASPDGRTSSADDVPPSYPPRRRLREDSGARPRVPSAVTRVGNGKLTWPLLALVLLLLALLGAAFADRLTRADGSVPTLPVAVVRVAGDGSSPLSSPASPGSDAGSAMITTGVSAASAADALTTTAKDS